MLVSASLVETKKSREKPSSKSSLRLLAKQPPPPQTPPPNNPPSSPPSANRKKWATASGSQFTFKADGTGTQANASGKEWPLKWTRGGDDLLTVDGWMDDKKATLYFRFPKSREGLFGSSPEGCSSFAFS